MRYFYLIFFVAYCLLIGQTQNEIEILNRMIDNSFLPIQDFIVRDSIKSVKLKIVSDNDKITALLRAKIFQMVEENNNSNYQLELVVGKCETKYPEIVSIPLFGEENVKREIKLEIFFDLMKNEDFIFQHHYNEVYSDTIPISAIKLNQKNAHSSDEIPSVPLWRSLVEPAIVSTMTGLIVYLFFIVRSK